MKRKRFSEEQIIANSEGIRGRSQEPGPLSETWDHAADVLPVAVEVRRDAGVGGEEAEGTGDREPEAEAVAGRSAPG